MGSGAAKPGQAALDGGDNRAAPKIATPMTQPSLQRMCDSSPRVFDSLFKTYAHMKKFRDATDTFCQMKDYGFLPTIESCNKYLGSLLDLNRVDIALGFYGKMQRQVGNSDMGSRLYEEMLRNGVKVDILTYNALILGLCKEGKTKKAANLVKVLDKENLVPNASTFSGLITGQCVRKNSERAFQLICLKRRITPDSVVLSELHSGLSQCGKDDLAMKLLNKMETGRLLPEGFDKTRKSAVDQTTGHQECRKLLRSL
ncbi:hypothetical protein Patl1_01842 [Pistacia atlantica]|uniref:Uncharacterized protein n=1 Tax=Pistacia atlantica TaxID=434234 RepID=A0ACC1CBW3_9ROSI|nr:hypothetical protein Patl1_01842 [Pistacia atlantica]